jgi:predicted nucleic acid-binding Zn finger protein
MKQKIGVQVFIRTGGPELILMAGFCECAAFDESWFHAGCLLIF